MYPYNNQFRDLRSFGRNPLIRGPGPWSLSGRTQYPRVLRRPSEYNGRFRQPPRNFPGPFKQPSASFGTDTSNVSTHSTVRWLNNNINLLKPTNTRVYSHSSNLISVSDQSQESVAKSIPISDTNQPSDVAESETHVIATELTKSVSNTSSDVAESETRILDAPSTELKSSGTDIDTTDGPGDPSLNQASISIPPWVKSVNQSTTNELNSAEKISTDMEPEISSIQDTEVKLDSMEGVEQSSNQTIEPTSATWSSVLEELQSSKASEEKQNFPGRGRGIASTKRTPRKRRRSHQTAFRKLQRGISRFRISKDTHTNYSSSNIYTDYMLRRSFHHPSSNFASSTAHASYPISQPGPYFYGNRMNQWNTQPPSHMLIPRTFNSGLRPRFPFVGERPVFGGHRWNTSRNNTVPYNVRNRRPGGQNSTSWIDSNRPASS